MKIENYVHSEGQLEKKLNEIIDCLNGINGHQETTNYVYTEPKVGDIWLNNENEKVYIQKVDDEYSCNTIRFTDNGSLISWWRDRSNLVKLLKRNVQFCSIKYHDIHIYSYEYILNKLKEELK